MARYESPEPAEIMDRLLWRNAQQMLDRHAQPGAGGRCEWCGWHWPCPPRRLAERAEIAASRPWPQESWPQESWPQESWRREAWRQESWAVRQDFGGVPSWGEDQPSRSPASLDLTFAIEEAPTGAAPGHAGRGGGLFD